jgi:dephospho-CoA kinase
MVQASWKDQVLKLKNESACFLLGVTGGIATGKSTVAGMLVEKGAVLIDFDDLAREVVMPGQPAYEEIVGFFGFEILKPDKTLDRKKLSGLVFQNPKKRKKLEGFIHPRANKLYVERVTGIIQKDTRAIIQTVIPLMIEVNMQSLFHKILLVYASPEVQVGRLMTRDRIDEAAATQIIKNQLPIDSKLSYADFIIQNGDSLAQTRQQVDVLWTQLLELQKNKGFFDPKKRKIKKT